MQFFATISAGEQDVCQRCFSETGHRLHRRHCRILPLSATGRLLIRANGTGIWSFCVFKVIYFHLIWSRIHFNWFIRFNRFVAASHEIRVEHEKLVRFQFFPIASFNSRQSRQGQVQRCRATREHQTLKISRLLPSKYRLSLLQDDWCWKSKIIDVKLIEDDVSVCRFVQLPSRFDLHRRRKSFI